MTIDNARGFIDRLRQDQNFRRKALATTGPEDLFSFLREESLLFNQRELVEAIGECMEQLDLNESIHASSRSKSFIERSERIEDLRLSEAKTTRRSDLSSKQLLVNALDGVGGDGLLKRLDGLGVPIYSGCCQSA